MIASSVEKHLDLVQAIKARDAGLAEQIMRDHVTEFYDRVREALITANDR